MPFGPDCEYADFQECKDANRDRDDPDAYCAAIQRRTEEHCMSNRIVPAAVAPGIVMGVQERPRLRLARPLARQTRPWYRITAKAEDANGDEPERTEPTVDGDTTLIDIYDEISWFGTSADDFVRDLRQVTTPKIELHLNSPGGDIFDAVAIYNALRTHKAQVHVIVDSLAASAASFIAMAGDKVTAMANAMLMIHDPWGLVIGNAADMRELADLLDKHGDNIASIYAARAGGRIADWRERMLAETWYLADEAWKAGLVDEVDDADGRPIEDRWDLTVFARAPEQVQRSDIRQVDFTAAALVRDGISPEAAVAVVQDTACPTHHTDTTDGTWEKATHEKRLPSPMSVATAKKGYGWYDPGRVEDGQIVKDGCKLLHHEVSEDGSPGVAHLGGVRAALSRLGQSKTDIPESERDAVQRHLDAHMEDAPQEDTTSTNGDRSGRSRDYLGGPAPWYLPPAGKETVR